MASVYHLRSDAHAIISQIIAEKRHIEHKREKVHYAALLIQRHGRGYLARQEVQRLHNAAIVLQKYIRRYLVKKNMFRYIIYQIEQRNQKFYDVMATKIQALWRGYKCRQVNREIFLIKEMQRLRIQSRKYVKLAQSMKLEMEINEILVKENEAKKTVLFILFKLHHLIRTVKIPGLLSDAGTSELSWIERLLKSLQFTEYMKELKKLYNKTCEIHSQPPFIFKEPGRLRNYEKLYYKSMAYKNRPKPVSYDKSLIQKRFINVSKVQELPYEPLLKRGITSKIPSRADNKYDSKLHPHDFDLTMKKASDKKKVPDYFIDFWNKVCEVHNIPEYIEYDKLFYL